MLGICFGGQALAAALGGDRSRAAETEIGWIDVDGDDGFGGRWFTWHEDVFDLPPGATELARSRLGPAGLRRRAPASGCSSTPRSTPAIVEDWLAGARDAVPDPEPIRPETARMAGTAREHAFALMDRIAARWPR